MAFQIRRTSSLVLVGSLLLASTVSCRRREEPENLRVQRGDDVVATGSMATIMDSVPGDAILPGGDASFGGVTGGDYLGAGGKQAITGRIHGSIRAAGGEIHVAAAVDRNVTIAGGSIALDSAAVIARNAYLFGGNVLVDGAVRGSLAAYGGAIVLNGVVGGDVDVAGGSLRIGPHAQIAGNLRYRVRSGQAHIDPAAHIAGKVTALPVTNRWGWWHLAWIFGFLVLGAVTVALVPRFMAEAAEILPVRPGRSALVGVGWMILVPIAVCIAAITIIGLPLALLMTAIYLSLMCVGSIPFSIWLGQLLLSSRARKGREGALINFLFGGFLLLVFGIIPIVGGWVSLVAVVLGLGTILLNADAVRKRQPVTTG
ncbi:MAG TPA: polymer-forming cytoskeletal protein [Gemmatimonadaceae bacterium]|nr:polymer-forming cytoskeletal protein [Gemmatimonadaceae bacterium]